MFLKGGGELKALAYIRVSTKEQDEEVQRKAIEEFAKKRDIIIMEWYKDKGESGAKPFRERPEAQRLLRELNIYVPDAIVVFAIDRIGRTMLDTVQTVLNFENKGIKVISVKEEWLQTLDSNMRRLILSILSWVAEFERKRMRERQLAAWAAGKQKGRPPKITDHQLMRYLKKYPDLPVRSLWKILKADGIDISYDWLRKRIKRLTGGKKFVTD